VYIKGGYQSVMQIMFLDEVKMAFIYINAV
jgi:hypothetical protein